MPDLPMDKARPHPSKMEGETDGDRQRAVSATRYAELLAVSNFSFLRGASHPDELVDTAAALGIEAVAITDRNTLSGIVRAHVAAKSAGIRLIVGCRLVLRDAPDIAVYPEGFGGYKRLCKLLTLGKRRAEKGDCELFLEDLLSSARGLLGVVISEANRRRSDGATEHLGTLREAFGDRLSIAARRRFGPDDEGELTALRALSKRVRVPLVAVNDVLYHDPGRRALQDVLTCIREGTTVEEAGRRLEAHAERHLKSPDEMARLLGSCPGAVARSIEIAERARFCLDGLRYRYPDEVVPEGKSDVQHLRELAYRGAAERYGEATERGSDGATKDRSLYALGGAGLSRDVTGASVPYEVIERIEHELSLIEKLRYAKYFLTVYDIVAYARSRGILCQGRGAAANSAVCYCLGITAVDPTRVDLLFERFISEERDEPPDIDIDFEHERREEVIQHVYQRFGRNRAALTAEVITYRGRSAVREVGRALGLSGDLVDRIAKTMNRWSGGAAEERDLQELGLDPTDPTLRLCVDLSNELIGFPRHLSQHVGGFVISDDPLEELVPIENAAMADRTVIEWDKDDIDAVGMLKVDCLGLGMLTCIRKCLELRRDAHIFEHFAQIAQTNDTSVYDMICDADTVGVFQIESRAQMQMLPRLKPRCYYDLVIEVAIVRPGPIQGNMVHPYLKRRNGEEPVSFPSPEVEGVLGKTLGVPLFQEQAMKLAVVAAGFTPGEADKLRRSMAAWKRRGNQMVYYGRRVVEGMLKNGYDKDFALRVFEQLKGFGQYGFPESHAASFALIVYISAWLKRHEPAAFAAALINSQPMGFYAAAQIVRDARDHGVDVRPIDVNRSGWDCRLEERGEESERQRGEGLEGRKSYGAGGPAIRLGMRLVKGLGEDPAQAIEDAVARAGPFKTVAGLRRASGVPVRALKALASADAFGSMGLGRREALWQIRALRDERLPLFEHAPDDEAPPPALPAIGEQRQVVRDYQTTGLSLRNHPVAFVRDGLERIGATPCGELADGSAWPHARPVTVAGVVLMRQRPGTAKGVTFITIEDESGIANLIVPARVYERDRPAARGGRMLIIDGRVERQGRVVHVMARRIRAIDERDLANDQRDLPDQSRDFR
ncbi:MAG: error-prone DNA polymerase [Planctomycetota bacterium]